MELRDRVIQNAEKLDEEIREALEDPNIPDKLKRALLDGLRKCEKIRG